MGSLGGESQQRVWRERERKKALGRWLRGGLLASGSFGLCFRYVADDEDGAELPEQDLDAVAVAANEQELDELVDEAAQAGAEAGFAMTSDSASASAGDAGTGGVDATPFCELCQFISRTKLRGCC